ncbi:MAG: hypothetical protein KBB37_14420 [Bacteroidia bacterium]|nr:hypothetical protein [Bacteroidia bacterium]
MKLEFLDLTQQEETFTDDTAEQLIRLSEFDRFEAAQFSMAIQHSLIENKHPLDLEILDCIDAVNCRLTLQLADEDVGITTVNGTHFICELTYNGYEKMLALIEPFCSKDRNGYQWLYELDNPIDFLFSPRGNTTVE